MKKIFYILISVFLIIITSIVVFNTVRIDKTVKTGITGNAISNSGSSNNAILYKSPSCGCCGVYANYATKKGLEISVTDTNDINQIKSRFNIPRNLQSCHTTQIGNYFVEGHVPIEAINKLLSEKPDIAGISLPGMPQGSPGMMGKKIGTWTIYAINNDGSSEEFMVI